MTDHRSKRLYYDDAYLTCFEARVIESLEWQGRPAVVLDRSAFYPDSGGQPCDLGVLGDEPVVDVVVREGDEAVIHVIEGRPPDGLVTGQVDWTRRFDHMQQHTGQHLLSAACEQLLDADTVSFHLGAAASTIDLAAPRLPIETLAPVEALVNRVIWDDRPVTARFVDLDELAQLALRRPTQVAGPVRLVEVEGFDLNPCGGTHVARSGEIGLLKLTRVEHRGQETRVEFLCGERALRDYGVKHRILLDLAAGMSVGYWELPQALARVQEELKTTHRELRAVRQALLDEQAARLAQTAVVRGSLRWVVAVLTDVAPGDLRALAQKVTGPGGALALLASSTAERVHLCAARSDGLGVDAAALLRAACAALGGKGGGQPGLAQGSAPPTPAARVQAALEDAVAQTEFADRDPAHAERGSRI